MNQRRSSNLIHLSQNKSLFLVLQVLHYPPSVNLELLKKFLSKFSKPLLMCNQLKWIEWLVNIRNYKPVPTHSIQITKWMLKRTSQLKFLIISGWRTMLLFLCNRHCPLIITNKSWNNFRHWSNKNNCFSIKIRKWILAWKHYKSKILIDYFKIL